MLPPRQRSSKVGRSCRRRHHGIIYPSAKSTARPSDTEDAPISRPLPTSVSRRQLAAAVVAFLGANNLMMMNLAHALEDGAVVQELETSTSLPTSQNEVEADSAPALPTTQTEMEADPAPALPTTQTEMEADPAPSLPPTMEEVTEEVEEEATSPSLPTTTYNIRGTMVDGTRFGEEGESANSFKMTGVYEPMQPQIPLSERKPPVGFSTSDWRKVGDTLKRVDFTSLGAASVAFGAVAYGSTSLIQSIIQTGNEEELRKKALERHQEFVNSQTENESTGILEKEEEVPTTTMKESGDLEKEEEASAMSTDETAAVSFMGKEYLMPKGADIQDFTPEEQRILEMQFAESTGDDKVQSEAFNRNPKGSFVLQKKQFSPKQLLSIEQNAPSDETTAMIESGDLEKEEEASALSPDEGAAVSFLGKEYLIPQRAAMQKISPEEQKALEMQFAEADVPSDEYLVPQRAAMQKISPEEQKALEMQFAEADVPSDEYLVPQRAAMQKISPEEQKALEMQFAEADVPSDETTAMIESGDLEKEEEASALSPDEGAAVSFLGKEYLVPQRAAMQKISPEEQKALEMQFAEADVPSDETTAMIESGDLEKEEEASALSPDEGAAVSFLGKEYLVPQRAAMQKISPEEQKALEMQFAEADVPSDEYLVPQRAAMQKISPEEQKALEMQFAEADVPSDETTAMIESGEKEEEASALSPDEGAAVSFLGKEYLVPQRAAMQKISPEEQKALEMQFAEADVPSDEYLVPQRAAMQKISPEEQKALGMQFAEQKDAILASSETQPVVASSKTKTYQTSKKRSLQPAVKLLPLADLYKKVWSVVIRFFNAMLKMVINILNSKPGRPSLKS